MRCTDCHFLYNPFPGGRNATSCSDKGEDPQNEPCSNFRPKGTNPRLPLAPTEIQFDPNKPIDYKHADDFEHLLGEQLQIERDVHAVIAQITQQFYTDGVGAKFDDATFKRYMARLVDLRMLHHLCAQLELINYREPIMAGEIERLFGGDRKTAADAIKKSQNLEKKNARLLRVPDDSDRTPVGGKTRSKVGRKKRTSSSV